MSTTPEGAVKTAIKTWFKKRGIWYFMPVQTGRGVVGVPDFLCCWRGRFIGVEAKAPGKRGNTTPLQDHQIMLIHQAGGAAIVVDDVSQLDALERQMESDDAQVK